MRDEEEDLRLMLRGLRIPPASPAARQRVCDAAAAQPRRLWKGLGALRQARALLYVPGMRYVVMASMVGFFMIVGFMESAPAPSRLTEEAMLIDVTFEEELWAEDLLKSKKTGGGA